MKKLLLATLLLGTHLGIAQALNEGQRREAFEAAWTFVRDELYDPSMRGKDWVGVRREFEGRLAEADSAAKMRKLLREMLGRLGQSHLGVLTRDEFRRSRVILPFVFDRQEGRVFVTRVLLSSDAVRVGDEILTVDAKPAELMRLPEVTHLDEMDQNPYTGALGSKAEVRLRRGGKVLTVTMERKNRLTELPQSELLELPDGGLLVRLYSAGEGTVTDTGFWKRLGASSYLVLDLRNCVGGDASFSGPLLGALLGPGVEVQKNVPRGAKPGAEHAALTTNASVRYEGPVGVLIGPNAESEPEAIAAALLEYGRARLFGENTRGAWSGNSIATGLPHGVGSLGVPRTRSVSPKGNDYEGVGVPPQERVAIRVRDLEKGRDVVLERALRRMRGRQGGKD